MKWLVVASACVVVGVATLVVLSALEQDDDRIDCESGFAEADWQRDQLETGRAIAECDWLDGESIASVQRALGKPVFPPHRGWYTWQVGDSSAGIGPSAWFLLLRTSSGTVTESRAEVRPI